MNGKVLHSRVLNYTHLVELTKSISQLDTKSVMQKVVNSIAMDIAGCDVVSFFQKETETLYRMRIRNENVPDPLRNRDVFLDTNNDELARQIIQTKAPVYISDTFADPRPDVNKLVQYSILSIHGLPVLYENEIYGIVFLHNFQRNMPLDPLEQDLIEAFVKMGAIALHNARYAENLDMLVKERTQELTVTNDKLEKLVAQLQLLYEEKSNYLATASHELKPRSP